MTIYQAVHPGRSKGATHRSGEQLELAGPGRGSDEDELVAAGRLERNGVALDYSGYRQPQLAPVSAR
jgi:hypothetical protein